jgi:hypothetical protein
MTKKHPSLCTEDSHIYDVTPSVISLALNARRLLDYGYGSRFDENAVQRLGAVVGLLLHTAEVAEYDDRVLESFFEQLTRLAVEKMYAIPTGYEYANDLESASEILEFDPPMIGAIQPSFDEFSRIRGGQIGLYSNSHLLFSPCLNFALLDVNGWYTMILGPRGFVDGLFGAAGAATWRDISQNSEVEHSVLTKLLRAKSAYGYDVLDA